MHQPKPVEMVGMFHLKCLPLAMYRYTSHLSRV